MMDIDEPENHSDRDVILINRVSPLESLCLKCISGNLGRFNTAYSTSSDFVLRHQLLFLQRRYSQHLLDEFKGDDLLEPCYLDFLVNKYLKKINVRVLADCNWIDVIRKIAEIGHVFQKVSFNGFSSRTKRKATRTRFVYNFIPHLRNLEVLHIQSICTDETLKIICSYCPMLKELDIRYSKVTREGLKLLCSEKGDVVQPNLVCLKYLWVDGTTRAGEDLQYLLRHMPCLENLNHLLLPEALHSLYSKDSGRTNDVKKLNLTKLGRVSWYGRNFSPNDILRVISVICPRLEKLDLDIMVGHQLELVSQFSNLEELNLEGDEDYRLDVDFLLQSIGGGLKRISFFEFTLSLPVLIRFCPKLESLTLGFMTYKPGPNNAVDQLESLIQLAVLEVHFNVYLVALLNSCPNLEKVKLKEFEFVPSDGFSSMFSQYSGWNRIKRLLFAVCGVKEADLRLILTTCTSLESLHIYYCYHIDCAVKERLAQMARSLGIAIKIVWIRGIFDDVRYDYNDIFFDNPDDNFDGDRDAEDYFALEE